jgi:hypothetical protein
MVKIIGKFILCTLAAGLCACSGDEGADMAAATNGGTTEGGPLEIRLAATLDTPAGEDWNTRSFDASNLINGDTVYVWTDMVNGSSQAISEYFKAWALQANGVGGLNTLVAGNTKLFPATNVLNFYAICGNFGRDANDDPLITAETTPLPTDGVKHTVLSDQSTEVAYYKSDLLYAAKIAQEPVAEAVQLAFRHMLSRIQIVLVAGNGMTASDLSEATVTLNDLKRQVIMKVANTTDPELRTDIVTTLVEPTSCPHGDIVVKRQVVGSLDNVTNSVYADAIVVPQDIAAGTTLIKVSYMGRDTEYKVGTNGLSLESGKRYRFRLIADRIGATYTVTPTIDNWTAVNADEMWMETD